MKKYAKYILMLACAALSGLRAEAAESVTIGVGEEKTYSYSRTSRHTWAVTSSDAKVASATLSTTASSKTSALTIRGVGGGTATVTVTCDGSSTYKEYAVTVKSPAVSGSFDYKGCTVTVSGVTTNYVGGELVMTFASGGTLSLSQDMSADILVVGGGGGGGGAYYGGSSSKYNGNGGNGGEVKYRQDRTVPASVLLTAKVGTAGEGGADAASGATANAGTDGGDSSLSGSSFETISATGGTKGAGGASGSNNKSGTAGAGAASINITGAPVAYGAAGAQAPSSGTAADVTAANGQGGQGGRASGTQANRKGGKAGSGVVIVRLKEIQIPREEIPWPTVAAGLVYDGTVQTGVSAEGICTFGGTWAAKDAGSYTASVTPASGYCWPDQTYGTKTYDWSIARRSVTVSVVATNKVVGAEEPVYPTAAEGFVDGDETEAEVSWKVWRTNLVEQADGSLGLCEEIGTYDLVIAGTAQTKNYAIAYANGVGAFVIRQAGPVVVPPAGGQTDVPEIKPVEGQAGVYEVEVKTDTTTVVVIDGLQPTDTVVVPSQLDAVNGTTSNPISASQVRVEADATNGTDTVKVDITGAFTITQNGTGVEIALNGEAEVVVKVGDQPPETIAVKPTLTDAGDAVVEPLTVAEETVGLGAKTIPGLTYDLNRSTELGGTSETVASEKAKGTRTALTDPMEGGRPPQAFYVIEVKK